MTDEEIEEKASTYAGINGWPSKNSWITNQAGHPPVMPYEVGDYVEQAYKAGYKQALDDGAWTATEYRKMLEKERETFQEARSGRSTSPFEPQRTKIYNALEFERHKQNAKFGDQSSNTWSQWMTILTEEVGEASKEVLNLEFGFDTGPDILKFREEMVQVAAVSVAILEQIDKEICPERKRQSDERKRGE